MARNKAIERTAAKRNATLITPTDLGAAASADIAEGMNGILAGVRVIS